MLCQVARDFLDPNKQIGQIKISEVNVGSLWQLFHRADSAGNTLSKDPYGIKDYEEMEEGEDETDTAPPPLVIRRAGFPTLEIETYIDLKAPKLTARFAADQGKPQQPATQGAKKPAKAQAAEWTEKDTEWDAADWDA
jgi:hypothetical protein